MVKNFKTTLRSYLWEILGILATFSIPSTGYSLFLNGEGYYGVRGESRSAPVLYDSSGSFKVMEHDFRLLGEARVNDNSSFYMEFRLFDNPRQAYFGDKSQPINSIGAPGDANQNQNSFEPGYQPYTPIITKASMRYVFDDMFILDIGRRERHWGLGALYNDATKPFTFFPSVFDGLTFLVNAQENSPISFGLGLDKITETGLHYLTDTSTKTGSTNSSDDLNQIFAFVEYDSVFGLSTISNSNTLGIYWAKITSGSAQSAGYDSNFYFLDFYMKILFDRAKVNFEIVKRGGKTADPNAQLLGGKPLQGEEPTRNDVESLGAVVEFQWLLSRTGGIIGPKELKQGNLVKHLLFANAAYAPGSSQGYFKRDSDNNDINASKREDEKATAMSFNFNLNPGLIMFNGRSESDSMKVDGIFDPARVMNTLCSWAGYRYESLESGTFEGKIVLGSLNESLPDAAKAYYSNDQIKEKPIGFYGKSLGTELDLQYSLPLKNEFQVNFAAAALLPGKAWKTSDSEDPKNNYLVQVATTFHF